jgi:hypothetical protein
VSLPPLVERYLERALPDGTGATESVDITQEGSMWMRPGARPVAFTATEHFETERVAFCWRARFRLLRISLDVVDSYDADHGLLELRVAGLRVRRQRSTELAHGEALRYLAELPWVPHALARNRELEWVQTGEQAVEVAAQVAGERAAVTFDVDEQGDVIHASALRKRQVGKSWELTPWGGDFSQYTVVDGIRMPATAEVYWELRDGERFVYWRGRVLTATPR